MRVTQHSSRGNKHEKGAFGTRHNDRNKIGEAKNIDKIKTANNVVWKYTDNDPTLAGQTFTIDEAELKFYKDHFSEVLNSTNESYLKARHKEKVRTMDEWRRDKKHAPEEIILQLGKIEDCPHKLVLEKITEAYLNKLDEFNKKHNNPFTILDYALHQDELGAPHIHLRRVWHYYNEEKNRMEVGQEKALTAAGIPLPHPDKKPGRYNNRKMVFDKYMRTIFISIAAKDFGLEIETTPLPKEEVGLTLEERISKNERTREEKTLELENRENKIASDEIKISKEKKYLEEAHEEIATWETVKNKTDEFMQKFDFDTNNEILKDSWLSNFDSPEKLKNTCPLQNKGFSKETPFEYANRLIKFIWKETKQRVKKFQEKYNNLYETVKTLYQEKLELKRNLKLQEQEHKKALEKQKKEYENFIYGEKTIIKKNGISKIKQSIGLINFANMFFSLDKKTIVNIYNEMEKRNIDNVEDLIKADSDNIPSTKKFLARHFKKAMELAVEVEAENKKLQKQQNVEHSGRSR